MIDPATGMKAGERYQVESIERAHQFPGFFLDGKYYLGPELLTAVGWLEGTRFIYDSLDPTGEPVFPDRIAGEIHDLSLALVDGAVLPVTLVEASAFVEPEDGWEPVQRAPRAVNKTPGLVMAAAMVLIGGLALATLKRRRH
ncbi:hypothetical protein PSEMO_24100 [Pseudomonas putida]|uniref:Short chain dehydrogenase n=1 Tax=Pseudomonas putida TaxID=303 RepID=A0A1Q9R5K8_PSEPU|nr:hypothetical protein PSEMO_24100 [Pseudomonas putida]